MRFIYTYLLFFFFATSWHFEPLVCMEVVIENDKTETSHLIVGESNSEEALFKTRCKKCCRNCCSLQRCDDWSDSSNGRCFWNSAKIIAALAGCGLAAWGLAELIMRA